MSMQAEAHNPRPRPPAATPAAGFAPVTPVGDTPLLSLVPPITQGEAVRHPDPISGQAGAQQPLPTNAQIPVAPVRRRRPVTPLIQLPTTGSLQAALQVAPLIPGQSMAPQPLATGPAAYGVQPTTFPFWSAPAFNLAPPAPAYMPPPLPVQTYVAFVTLMPQQQPQWMPQQQWAPQPQWIPQPQFAQPQPYMPMQPTPPMQPMQPQQFAPQPYPPQPQQGWPPHPGF